MRRLVVCAGLALWTALALSRSVARADDWPTHMHDAAQSGVTSERLELPLVAAWTYKARHAPRPAWPDQLVGRERLALDDAFHVVVAGGAVYFGSSAEDDIRALDAATGRLRWRTFTDGPVRLAPTVWQGRVFAGSDDGHVYCLDATDGKVLWTFRAAPRNRRILGMGRMISSWPIRTGVLVDNSVAYFGAGLFPTEGVYIYAVEADSGKMLWKNDTSGQLYVKLPHAGAEGFSGIAPQGALLASATRLYVPNGRNVPAALDRRDGRLVFWRSATKRVGGVWALLTDQHLVNNSTSRFRAFDRETGVDRFGCFPGQGILITPETSYLLTTDQLLAVDRERYIPLSKEEEAKLSKRGTIRNAWHVSRVRLKALRRDLKREGRLKKTPCPEEQKFIDDMNKQDRLYKAAKAELKQVRNAIDKCIRWRVRFPQAHSLVLADGTVFAGRAGEVVAFDAVSGKKLWMGEVAGTACSLAVADGRLVASTDTGAIHCFGKPGSAPPEQAGSQPTGVASPYPADRLTPVYAEAAETILRETGVTKGYCLVLGCGTGRLAYALARRSQLHIIGIEPDARKVATARTALASAGVYGVRVSVSQGLLSRLPYASYFADLVVSDTMLEHGKPVGSAKEVYRVLRPGGGAAFLGRCRDADAMRRFWAGVPTVRVLQTERGWACVRRAPLPGAGHWSHQYADPGNSGCGTDRRVQTPFQALWFGRPGPGRMINRHARGSGPVSTNGRLFIQGEHRIMAVDIYNGRTLWEHKVPGARRVGLGIECSNLAGADQSVYLAVGKECLRFEAATGKELARFRIPQAPGAKPRQWGYVALDGDILFGSTARVKGLTSDSLFAVDRKSGKRLWVDTRTRVPHTAIAVGAGAVFLVEGRPEPKVLAKVREECLLVALDVKTGHVRWEKPFDAEPFLDPRYLTNRAGLSISYADGRVFVGGSARAKRLMALTAQDGRTLWSIRCPHSRRPVVMGDAILAEPFAYGVRTGKMRMRRHPVTGKRVPWRFIRAYACGGLSASPHCLFFRSGCVGFYDVKRDGGTSNWGGVRPGCWTNIIAAGGLVLMPEASSGCTCSYPMQTTLALEPAPRHEEWAVFHARGPTTPVKHLAVNLGAPGDRRAPDGTLWFSYPRPPAFYGVKLELKQSILDGMGCFRRNSNDLVIDGTDKPWIYASGCRGLLRCVIPLVDKGQTSAVYTVKLGFAELDHVKPGVRVFDVKLQGKLVDKDFDIVQAAGAGNRAVIRVFPDVRVSDNLTVELVPKATSPTARQAPMLSSIEVIRTVPPGP